MRNQILSGALVGVLALAYIPSQAAAAPVESPGDLVISPSDPNLWVLRYDYGGGGFLYSQDAGQSWSLVCNTAIDRSINKETTAVAIAPSGKVFTGVFTGLWEIGAGGCGATMAARFDGQWVSDVINDPNDPNMAYAITSSGAEGSMNGIFAYDGTSETWSPMGTREDILISRVRVTKTDSGRRFYESMVDGEVMVENDDMSVDYFPNYYIRYSDDDGETWTAHQGFLMTDGRVRLEAIDPTNPDRIVVSETFGDMGKKDVIWVNDQAGDPDSYTKLGEVDEFGGLTFAPDGRLWFSDSDGTVHFVAAGGTTATPIGQDIRARCLTYDATGERLMGCRLLDLIEIAEDGAVAAVLDFRNQDTWVECDGESVAPMCETQMAATNWCNITHFPEAGICAAFCYPGLNDMKIGMGGQCDPGTITPETMGTGDGDSGDGDSGGDMMGDGDSGMVMVPVGDGDSTGDGDGDMGTAGTGPNPPASPTDDGGDDDGCSVAGDATGGASLWLVVAAALGWLRRRRKLVG